MALDKILLIVVGQKVMSGEEYVPQDFIAFFLFQRKFSLVCSLFFYTRKFGGNCVNTKTLSVIQDI